MMVERLKEKFGYNEPIFTSEILEIMSEYSRSRVFQLINEAIKNKTLVKSCKGVYYVPKETILGTLSKIPEEYVVDKKYIKNNDEIFGIYGGIKLELAFLLTYQVPVTIEVITNNETMSVRRFKLNGRNIVLRKSRLPITNENVYAYTILELFTNIVVEDYLEDPSVRREVKEYIDDNKITKDEIYSLIGAFPARTIKHMMECKILNEFA